MTKDQRNGLERSVVSSAWEKHRKTRWNMPFWCIPVAFFMIEVYALICLELTGYLGVNRYPVALKISIKICLIHSSKIPFEDITSN